MRKKKNKGPRHSREVDDLWRQRVRDKLKELGWKQSDLERESCVGKSTLSGLLGEKKKRKSCKFLEEIHEALGWPPPLPAIFDAFTMEWLSIWQRATQEQRNVLLRDAAAAAKKVTEGG
jgi:transcriptional regulator with XRE-family HTH domain